MGNNHVLSCGVRAGMNPAPTVDGYPDFITAHPTNPVALIKARKTFVPASLELYVTGGSIVPHRRHCCTSLVAVLYITGGSVVAGLVPATSPWYGIVPTHQRDQQGTQYSLSR